MKFKPSALLLFFASSFLILSCGQKASKEDENSNDFDKAKKDLGSEIQDIYKCVPKPSEVPYLIQSTGAEFNPNLVNDRRKADGYSSQTDKAAMNLGAYTADIGYLSSYDKTQEAINHLAVCKSLADKLGVAATFDQSLLKKFESNIGNKDVLAHLLDSASLNARALLKQGNQKLAALMIAGSFIESLYIATGIIKTYPKDFPQSVLTPIIKIIMDQKCSVTEVSGILSTAEQTGSVPTIVADLKALETSYSHLSTLEEQIKKGDPKLVLTNETLAEITTVVEKLRGDMVN